MAFFNKKKKNEDEQKPESQRQDAGKPDSGKAEAADAGQTAAQKAQAAAQKAQEQGFRRTQREYAKTVETKVVRAGEMTLPPSMEKHRETLEKNNRAGMMGNGTTFGYATNDISVNTRTIKDEKQLAFFSSTLADTASKRAVIKQWAKENGRTEQDVLYATESMLGSRLFSEPQSKMGKLGSLYDRNGDAININTASPELVEQGIRGTADDDARKAQAKAFYALCRAKGSRFYGYVPSDDLEVFRDSASLTKSGYNSAAKEYRQLFRQDEASKAYNETAYATKRQYLETTDTLDSLSRKTLIDLLDKSYRGVTGSEPPSDIDAILNQAQPAPADATPEEEKGPLQNIWDSIVDAVSSPTPPPETDAADAPKVDEPKQDGATGDKKTPNQDAAPKLTDANGNAPVLVASASPTPPPVTRETDEQENAQADESDAPEEAQGPVYRPSEGTERAAKETNAEPVVLNTMSDAYGLLRQGRADLLPDYARRYLDALGKSSGVRMLWGEMDEEGMQQVKTGNEPAEYREMLSMARLGTTIASAMADVKSQDFPEELRNEAMMVLTGIVYSADQAVRSGQIVPREGVNLYEDYLNAYPKARESVQSIYDGWKTLLEDKAELDAQRQKDGEQFARDAREAVASGVYSDAQYASVLENSNVKDADVYQTMYATPFINEFEYIYSDYFTEGGGFDQSMIKTKLNADGVKDDMDYRYALRDSMNALYYEDAKMAVTLGMSVEDYYARMGGMTVEQLAQRANRRMQAQAQTITQEEIAELDAPYGEGVGAGTATAEAVKRGGNALLTMFADTLYVGKNALTMERTASAMRATYQGEWGVFGRDQYRRDMEALLESGNLDERYAKALEEALATAGDVYDIGIDPRDIGGVISFAGDRRRAVEQSDTMMRTKGTEGENAWYRLFSSTVTNAGMMGASAAVGAVAGPVAGFAAGYGLPNYGERVYARLDEGYTMKSANALAAYDTAGMVAANVATFGKVFGELSGSGALQRLGYLTARQQNASGLVKFASAARTFLGTFVGNEIDEAVKDPIKEGVTQRFIDNAIAPLYRKTDEGEDVSASDMVISMASALTPAALAKTAKDTLADTVQGAPEEAVYSVLFSLAGAGGETFHSVRMANDVLAGKSKDIGAVMEAVVEDAKDPAFAEHIDEAAKQNRIDEKTVEAIAAGVGEEDRQTAARAREKETEYRKKEAAAEQASAEAKQRYQDVRERVLGGEVEADVELENALDQWGKAETARQEAQTAAQTAGEKADEAEQRVLDVCRADASARVRAEKESARARAKSDVQTRVDMLMNEAKDLRAQSDAMNEEMVAAYERGATMEELDEIGTNAGLLLTKAMDLEEQASAMQKAKETDKAQAAMDEAQARVDAAEAQDVDQQRANEERSRMQEELASIRQALSAVQGSRAKKIFLNDKQKAEVLAKTGLRSISQVNSRYGTRFRVRMQNADMALDGNFYMEVAGQSGNLLDESSAHPESDLIDLMDRAMEIDRQMGMQASVGDGRKAESYLPETVSRGTLDPVTQKLAGHLKQKTGLDLIVMPLANNIRGLYDRKSGRLILSNRIGAGEVMRQVVTHELTHYVESTRGYAAYEDAALNAAYRGNEDALERDANELRQRYKEAGVSIDPDDVHRELVAAATEKLLDAVGAWGKSGSETLVYDLLGVKQSFPVRLYNKLTQFLAGRRAKKTGEEAVQNYNALVTARDNLKKAISDAGMWEPGKGGQDTTVELDSAKRSRMQIETESEQTRMQYDIAPRAFGSKTVQRADAISDQVKQLLEGDTYETITNDAMIRQANERVDRDGIDSVVRNLAGKENWTPEDTASALVSMVRASNEDMLTQAAMIGMELNRRGTEMGQNIQLYSVLKKLTPAGAIMETTKTANEANRKKGVPDGNIPVGNQPPVKRTGNGTGNDNGKVRSGKPEKTGKKTNGEITAPETRSEDLPDVNKRVTTANQSDVDQVRMGEGDAVQGTFIEKKFPEKLEKAYNRADAIKTELDKLPQDVSWDNPWGVPLNPAQMELIRQYGLMGVKLPGDNYSVASLKQRMLCAIIATPNNVRGDGLMTLCQQLEAMKAGYAVVTEADLNYINGQMSTYLYAEGPEHDGLPVTAEGKMALSRVYDAQGNTVQSGFMEQLNAFGYTNMLSSTKTWAKNIASNVLIRPLELASEKIGGVIEQKLVTPKTGNRTTDAPNRAERKSGKDAFRGEIGQTMVDYFVTHADTGHGNGFDLNRNGRTFNKGPLNEMLNAYKNIVDFAMQIGDRPFWEQCYAEELAVIRRLGMKIADTRTLPDGRTVDGMRDMTLDEMKTEAAVRATERVFQEDSKIVNGINKMRQESPGLDLVMTTMMPFVKTPTNVGARMVQYSPLGLARAILQYGLWDGKRSNGKNFDQRKFVMNLGRGLTGTGLAFAGAALASAGVLLPGYEDEKDKDRRTIRKGMGESYSPYLRIGDMEIPIDFAQPSSGPLYIGAQIIWELDKLEDADAFDMIVEVAKSSAFAAGDQLFNNSFLSGINSLFRGYNDFKGTATNIATNIAENRASRMTPSMIRAIAKWSDPYVRDTASQNWMHQFVNEQLVQNWPILRQTLPAKTDVTGDRTLQSGYYSWGKEQQNAALHMLNSFALPMNAIGQKNDDTLDALLDLSYRTGEAGFLPGELISGNKYELSMNKTTAKKYGYGDASITMQLTDEEKRKANRAYGDLLFNGDGGRPFWDGKGNPVRIEGLRSLMNSAEWALMDDDARMKRVSDEASKVKELIIVQTAKQKKEEGEL